MLSRRSTLPPLLCVLRCVGRIDGAIDLSDLYDPFDPQLPDLSDITTVDSSACGP